jgi:hypothetical protein
VISLLPLFIIVTTSTSFDSDQFDFSTAATLSFTRIAEDSRSQPEASSESKQMEEATNRWGKKDTWRWNLQGSYAKDVKDSSNTLETYGVEFEYFMEDNLSLDLGFFGINVDQVGPSANGFNFTLQLRWHFISKESWSMFLEGGAGLLRTTENVPTGGSKFNFTPQAGVGFSYDIGNNNRWLIGVKWHHISNANTYATNPGRDSIMVWTGISFPF